MTQPTNKPSIKETLKKFMDSCLGIEKHIEEGLKQVTKADLAKNTKLLLTVITIQFIFLAFMIALHY